MSFLGPLIGGIGSLFGGLFGAHSSSKASEQYIKMLQQAQSFLQGQEQQGLQNYSPYLNLGQGASSTLSNLIGTPGQGLLTPWTQTFQAPTAEQARQTPGYQFQLQQGLDAMQNSAAGRGGLLSGRTLADLNNYAQGTADSSYNDTFNRSLTQYQQAYQAFQQNQANTYQRLMGATGIGLQGAQGAGNLISGIGGDIASLMGQQGAARAGGTIGAANSITGMIPGILSGLQGLPWGKWFPSSVSPNPSSINAGGGGIPG